MDTINSALLVADEQAVAHNSLDMGSNAALLARNQKIIRFSTLCLARTRSIRNTKAEVSRLHNELLLAVFRILSAVGPPTAWLRVTHVCSHWRTLALSDPLLWTEIDCELPAPLIELLLLRSRNMPLSLLCKHTWVIDRAVVQAMLRRNVEVRHLSIEYPCTIDLLCVFLHMLPNLKSLYIDPAPYTGRMIPLFNRDRLPNLRSLVARQCSWQLVSSFVRSLQILDLYLVSGLRNIATLLDALDACPALEVLMLSGCMPSQPHGEKYHSDRVVALPKLMELTICESSQEQLGFLCSCLSLPADTIVYLVVECSALEALPLRKEVAPVPHIFLKDQSLWPMLADAKRLAFGFHMDYIILYMARDANSHTYPFLQTALDITADFPPAAALLPEVLDMWLTSMTSPNVTSIDIHGAPKEMFPGQSVPESHRGAMEQFRADLWPRVFASFPNLADLFVHCVQDITALANALCGTSGDVSVPAPELKKLTLRCSLDALARGTLLRALTYRNSRGARLDALRLTPPRGKEGSTLPDDFVEDIGKLVDELFLESGRLGEEGYKKESEVEVSVDTSKPSTAVPDEAKNESN